MTVSLKLIPSGKTGQFRTGTLVLDALLELGIRVKSPCGGKGICGKCRTRINGSLSPKTPIEEKALKNEEGMRLACQTFLEGNAEAHIEETSAAERKTYPPINRNESYAVAVDVGTTSIQIDLLGLTRGMIFHLESFLNPQRRFGHDIISRIAAANDPENHRTMTRNIRQAIFGTIQRELEAMGLPFRRIEKIVFSGNTTMIYLLFGLDVSPLGRYPFQATTLDFLNFSSRDFHADLFPEARIFALPSASAFLGGDFMGGLTLCRENGFIENTFFMDLGTNGELYIQNGSGSVHAASCAMGPALEGMNMSCGMTADTGAITHAWIDGENLEYEMIGNGSPSGLTGTAMIDLVACFLKLGLIQKNGAFSPDLKERKLPGPARYAEDPKNRRILLWNDIAVTQADIRNLQLAKGAGLAASRLLLRAAGCKAEDIRHVLIAGALGSHLAPDNFRRLGFIPEFPQAAFHDLGNTSLQAAGRAGMQDEFLRKAIHLRDYVNELNLAVHPEFGREFISAMNFPDMGEDK